MEQIITASRSVKPSSPTPLASKTHKLSFLDQVAPPVYLTLIFFYENAQSQQHDEISRRLKQSLSEILTIFYPLAGTIKQNTFVDCNDSGANFAESRVHARLAHFTQNPKMEQLGKLIPAGFSSAADNPTLSVKTSYFDCGGVAVAVFFPHTIGDTSCFATFMNAWAAASRGEASRIIHPSFDLALRFPPRDIFVSGFRAGVTEEKIATRRLVFDKEKVESIRELEASRSEVKDPSRVEAVSAFLWRSFIRAHKQTGRGETETASFPTCHMVSMRRRAAPPVADRAFGNCFTLAPAVASGDGDEEDVLVSRLRAAIRGVDEDYVAAIGDGEFARAALDEMGRHFGWGNCVFTSWLRFPLYDVDFGWGKPVRVCPGTMPYMNLVILMDTPSGDGIEAWINVPHDQFFQFIQADYNMLLT
ncbi:stemmadenine O-acetyltransferase-like [Salvia miltiorrhiza]|uniref:stemmadenine O-acetyltransferase-like n=1 Tax=Salvia miltiorrhiza TaxID=226208 RepID=UPI0025AC53D8|nr:stemmadenine O-acetyltransferase-like [Salvia miltiorrhiza]